LYDCAIPKRSGSGYPTVVLVELVLRVAVVVVIAAVVVVVLVVMVLVVVLPGAKKNPTL